MGAPPAGRARRLRPAHARRRAAPLVDCWSTVLGATRRILGRQLPLFAAYAFVLVPLGNLELGSFLSRGIELPPFIAAEVQKTQLGAVVWALGAAAVLYVNLRLALVPVLLVTEPRS